MTRPRSVLAVVRAAVATGLATLVIGGTMPAPRPVPVAPGTGVVPASVAAPGDAAPENPDTGPAATPDATPPSPPGAGDPAAAGQMALDGAGQQPSVAYQEWLAHQHDRITFVPGGRVTVGFTPRADDSWPVDGQAPTTLPGGLASGREMAASPQGSQWAGTSGMSATSGGAPIAATAVGYTATTTDPAADPAAASGLRRQVFGFLPYWELPGSATRLDPDVLSTIAYFSVGADAGGNLMKRSSDGSRTTGWSGWTSADMTAVISTAHRHGTRVVLTVSVFAWTPGQAATQRALLGSPAARLTLARQVAAAVRDRGADGVNLDFEPLASGYEREFVALLRTVRDQLDKVRSGYQLTYDTTGYIGNYPLEASVGRGAADAVFVMGYDYRTASSTTAGSIDPLSGPMYDLADTIRAYTARISPSRVILGIPWYGRAWSTRSDAARSANISGTKYGYSTAVTYDVVAGLVAKHGRRWDPVEQSPYVVYRRRNCTSRYGCVTSWRQVYYDDAASMRRRYALVNDYGLRGAGIWALGYDGGYSALYRAIARSFLVTKSAPQAGIVLLPTRERDEGFVVRWAASGASKVASYDVQVSTDGGPWSTWLSRTRATSGVWLGSDGHGYAFRVRATDRKGHTGSWNTTSTWTPTPALEVGGFGRVRLDGLAYRAGPSTRAARLGRLPRGTILAVTGGPVRAGGYTWWEVTQPIREWGPVSFVERGVWVAASSSSATYVVAYRAPNSTTVAAGLRGLDLGSGATTGVGSDPAAVAARSLSPDGDGSGDTLQLRWTNTVALDSLTLRVYRTDGSLVGARRVRATRKGVQVWSWNGRLAGSRLPDGRYLLQLVGVAGGRRYTAPSARPTTPAQIAAYAVTVDTAPPTVVSYGTSSGLLSPNGDGRRDTVTLSLSARGATHWLIRIANAAGSVVRTATGNGRRMTFAWQGTDDRGRTVADGSYTATLLALDAAGNSAGGTVDLQVDTTPPAVSPTASPGVFSPNGDHLLDKTALAWAADELVWGQAGVWKGTRLIRSWPIARQAAGMVTWDGRDAAGRLVADGRYTFKVRARDRGRTWTTVSTRIVVDRTAAGLRWARSFYPQDGDTLAQTSRLTWTLSRPATTTLRVYDDAGRLVRTVWAGRTQTAGRHGWTWNGRLTGGNDVAPGRYQARLTVTSRLGTVVLQRSVWVTPFQVRLSASTVSPGQTLTVRFRSIEPLAARPRVVLEQPGRAAVSGTVVLLPSGWYRVTFRVRPGAAGTATVTIVARDAGGHRNRLTVPVRVAS